AKGRRPKQIARALNDAGAPTPGKAGGWQETPSAEPSAGRPARGTAGTKASVREGLLREADRGLAISRGGGAVHRVAKPELRVVAEEEWAGARARLDEQRAVYLRSTNGRLFGKPSNGVESNYLLTGLLRCAACGSGMTVVSRAHGRKRARFYQCLANVRG